MTDEEKKYNVAESFNPQVKKFRELMDARDFQGAYEVFGKNKRLVEDLNLREIRIYYKYFRDFLYDSAADEFIDAVNYEIEMAHQKSNSKLGNMSFGDGAVRVKDLENRAYEGRNY